MFIAVRIASSLAAFLVAQAAPAEEFVWQYHRQTIGRLSVPAGFAMETYDYREGIVTTLRYSDGASIVLQFGGLYRVPFFQDADHNLTSSAELAAKTIRVGRIVGETSCWREDNFKRKKTTGKSLSRARCGWTHYRLGWARDKHPAAGRERNSVERRNGRRTARVFKPTLLNGGPIEVITNVCVPFVLPQSKQSPSPCAAAKGPVR
jgi:hypothetical protein